MKGTIVTKKGFQLLAKLAAAEEVLVFSRAAVGTGKIPNGKSPEDMEDLVKYHTDGSISSVSAAGNKATVIFQVSSLGVAQAFTITEAGLFATDPDEGEILYSYLDMSDAPQRIYEEGSEIAKFFEATMAVIIGSAEKVSAYIDTSSLVTQEKLAEGLDRKVDKVQGKGLSANDFTDADKAEVNRLGNSVIVTLPAAGWSGTAPYTLRVAVAGIKETDKVYVHPYTPKGIGAAALKLRRKLVNMMNDVDSENGALLFSCEEKKPTVDFPVLVEGVSVNG